MLTEQELELLESPKIRMTHYIEKMNDTTYGPYVFEINTDIQRFSAQYFITVEEDGEILLKIREELAPILAQKAMYNLLFRMRKQLQAKLGEGTIISLEEELLKKIEVIKDL